MPTGTYVDITTAAQSKFNNYFNQFKILKYVFILDKGINFTSNSNNAVTATPVSNSVNQAQAASGRSQITAKSEVSQATAISDRPKAKPKISRKHQQTHQQTHNVSFLFVKSLLKY